MLAIATILSFVWLFVFNRKKLNAKWWEITVLCLIHTTYGVLTVLFFAILESGFDITVVGSISLFGGIFFMPLMYFVYAKIKNIPLSIVFDVFSIALASTLFFARLNCLHAGCCQGIIMDSNGIRWPAREIDLLAHLLFIIFAAPRIISNQSKGKLYPYYMIIYGLTRFANEWLRENESSSPIHIAHIWSIVSFVIGTTFIIIIHSKQKGGVKNEK